MTHLIIVEDLILAAGNCQKSEAGSSSAVLWRPEEQPSMRRRGRHAPGPACLAAAHTAPGPGIYSASAEHQTSQTSFGVSYDPNGFLLVFHYL